MTDPRPLLDVTEAAEVRRVLRLAAENARLPVATGTPPTWAEVLFGDGDEWTEPGEPSQALLAAFTELHAGLAEHLRTVPARVQAQWLRDRLGIAGLPAVADRVVVAATADPARTPVALPAGTAVRAKDDAGNDRRYATSETLTVHGIELVDVVAHGAEEVEGVVSDTAARWADPAVPFAPFTGQAPAAHRFFVLSDLLAFPSGTLTVELAFTGADPSALNGATWEHSTPGGVGPATVTAVGQTSIRVQLKDGCTAADVLGTTAPYLCVSLPPSLRTEQSLGFAPASVTVRVVTRAGVMPDAAFANDGKLDPTKEMEPFGPTPRRGDAFYVRSDEAFGKPLAKFTVNLTLLESGVMAAVPWSPIPLVARSQAELVATEMEELFGNAAYLQARQIIGHFAASAEPLIEWQAHDGTTWFGLQSTGDQLTSVTWESTTAQTKPLSAPVDLGGEGHFVRAFLAEGDFGWAAYQQSVADFAAAAATPGGTDPSAGQLIPPDPPILSALSIDYETVAVPPAATVSVDGWTTRHPPASGPHHAFDLPFELAAGRGGMVAIGLRVGAAALGTALSLYVDIASAPACGSGPDSPLRWEVWTAAGTWAPLDVADGTHGLRQSGLLRFVAPLDWPEGCEGTSAAAGRWIRAVTTAPETVGVLLAVVPDAVEAVQELAPGAPVTVFDALAPKKVKGLLTAAPGVKKVTNPIAGLPGRPAEDPEQPAYLSRASGAVRHRRRAATAWDCEALIAEGFPEVAAVRCLPHTGPDGESAPGWIGAVVVPHGPDRLPLPSVSLSERIGLALAPALAVNADLAVLCPEYRAVTVRADIVLTPGAAAVDARARITGALEALLHPTASDPVRFGVELFGSSVAAWLEALPDVDHLVAFDLLVDGAEHARVTVDPCRGIVGSAGDHALTLQERL